MTSEELKLKFIAGKYDFYGVNITTDIDIFNSDLSRLEWLRFDNCIFEEISLYDITNIRRIIFHNCTFNNINLTRCEIEEIQFSFIKYMKNLSILYGRFDTIRIDSNNLPINSNIEIDETAIFQLLDCSNLYIKEGQFTLGTRYKPEDSKINFRSDFDNSKIDIINFSSCIFGNTSSFKNLEINKPSFFIDCAFKKVLFQGSNMGNNAFFKNCTFEFNSNFKDCKDLTSITEFISCSFNGYSHLNNSKFNHLVIQQCTFEKKLSLDLVEVNTIKLYQNTFEDCVYFDNIKINKIEDCDIKTIRTIKQELQKAENRIDFNRFRNYELIAHYKELSFKNNFKDKFILGATKLSSNFGSWTWAFWFTVLSGLLCYSILYRIENSSIYNPEKINEFFVGAFRFFLVTDFHNPMREESPKAYLTSGWSWLIFILGKIFIAFGIYEMIQSFRKFKA